MKLFGQIVAVLLVMSALVAVGAGLYAEFGFVVALTTGPNRQVAGSAVIACVIALAAVSLVTRDLWSANRRHSPLNPILFEQKTSTYQLFLDYWENSLRQPSEATRAMTVEMNDKLLLLNRLLALYGSAQVIQAHKGLLDLGRVQGAKPSLVRAHMGEVLMAIRSDIGIYSSRALLPALEALFLEPEEPSRPAERTDLRIPSMSMTHSSVHSERVRES